MPRIACQMNSVPKLLDWTRALTAQAEEALSLKGVPESRHDCQVWLERCNETIVAATRLCGGEVDKLFRAYDLRSVPADNLPSACWRSYLHHAAVTLSQLAYCLEQKILTERPEEVQPRVIPGCP